jgi:hypothetical protein
MSPLLRETEKVIGPQSTHSYVPGKARKHATIARELGVWIVCILVAIGLSAYCARQDLDETALIIPSQRQIERKAERGRFGSGSDPQRFRIPVASDRASRAQVSGQRGHWCAHDSTGRTNSEHRDGFPAAGPPPTTDWDFVLDFGIRRRDHWKADAGKVFGENPRSLAANHPKEEG